MGFGFEDLEIYKRSRKWNKEIYKVTDKWPKSELYCLTSQLRRASISITANIAEGSGRKHHLEQKQFYNTSRASLYECVALIDIACDLEYVESSWRDEIRKSALEMLAMLNGLIHYASRKEQ